LAAGAPARQAGGAARAAGRLLAGAARGRVGPPAREVAGRERARAVAAGSQAARRARARARARRKRARGRCADARRGARAQVLPGGRLLASADEAGGVAVHDLRALGAPGGGRALLWHARPGSGGITSLAAGLRPVSGLPFLVRHPAAPAAPPRPAARPRPCWPGAARRARPGHSRAHCRGCHCAQQGHARCGRHWRASRCASVGAV